MSVEIPSVPLVPIVNLPNVVANSMVVESIPQPDIQTIGEFFETRNFSRFFGVLGVASTALIAYLLYRKYAEKFIVDEPVPQRPQQQEQFSVVEVVEEDQPVEILKEDIKKKVVLYQVPRGFFTPAVAPFALKLETFMRVAKIEYEVHLSTTKSEVDTPWIKIGDEEVTNNSECISFLSKKFDIDLTKGCSNSRKTASRMCDVMLDSRVYWGIALWRWVYDQGKSMKDIQPLAPSGEAVLDNVRESVMRAAHYQGIGRLSKEEVISSVIDDLAHLSAALGKHPYFMGNSPGEVDCNAFSLLSQMIWNMPGSPFEEAIRNHKVLMDFAIRMREKFWPDWEELIQNQDTSKVPSKTSIDNKIDPSFVSTATVNAMNANPRLQQNNAIKESISSKYIGILKRQSAYQGQPQVIEESNEQPNFVARQQQISQLERREPSPGKFLQIKNPQQQVQRSQVYQEEPEQIQYHLNQINQHHQLLQQGENPNQFQQIRNGIQEVNQQMSNNNPYPQQYAQRQPQVLPQYAQQQTAQQLPRMPEQAMQMNFGNNVSDAGQYYSDNQSEFMHERMQRAAQASLFQQQQQQAFDQNQNQNQAYVQRQFYEQEQKQCFQPGEPDQYAQQGNNYNSNPPASSQSQVYRRFWN